MKWIKKLSSLKTYLEQGNTLLSYIQFKSLLESIKGVRNPTEIILKYTPNLQPNYPNVRDSSIKRRCTLLVKKILDPNSVLTPSQTPEHSDNETENSQTTTINGEDTTMES